MNSERAAFKAILWKEFRENLKWAILGLILVSLGVVYCIERLITRSANAGDPNWQDLSFSMFGVSMLVAPVVGLMIGLAQVVLENRGDNWGFLTHRPVERSTLFWGKSVSGMLLYFFTVGVPFAFGLLWIATPGHLPMPFDAHIALPVIADILCGLVYYFAGLLTGMRDARWYASRLMGIGLGMACSAGLSFVTEFWQAVACCAVAITISAASAWGAFIEGGRLESQPRLKRFATGVALGAGLFIVGLIIFSMASSFLPPFLGSSRGGHYDVTGDGTLVRVISDDGITVDVQDLQGKSIERYRNREPGGPALSHGRAETSIISRWDRVPWNDYRDMSEYIRAFQSNDVISNGGNFTWYYVSRLGRIAAYENRSAKLIGWLGPHGFISGTEMPADRFEHPLTGSIPRYNPTLIAFEDTVYRLDLNHRHIERIFTADSGESIIGASDSNTDGALIWEHGEKARFAAIYTTKRVVIQSHAAATQLVAPRDPRDKNYGSVIVIRSLLSPEPQTFIWYANGFGTPGFIAQFGSSGTVVARYELPGLFQGETLTWGYVLLRSVMEPTAMRVVMRKHSIFDVSFLRSSPEQRLVSWLVPILEGVLFAALVFARGRRYAFSNRRLGLWTAIGFALGPLGYALMLSLLEWPAFEDCPGCGHPRLVTHENCEHCSEPFLTPDFDGTEVFEPIG